ncbi:hypothetical protein R80B4_02642 [Fibrobacteres bacterium R8-0-B4]
MRPSWGRSYRNMGPIVKRRLTGSRLNSEASRKARMTPAVASGRNDKERPLRSGKVYISFCTTSVSKPMEREKSSANSSTGVRNSIKPYRENTARAQSCMRVKTSLSGGNISANPLMRVTRDIRPLFDGKPDKINREELRKWFQNDICRTPHRAGDSCQ